MINIVKLQNCYSIILLEIQYFEVIQLILYIFKFIFTVF